MQGCGKVRQSKKEKGEKGSSPVPAERRVSRRGGRPAPINRCQRAEAGGDAALQRRRRHVVASLPGQRPTQTCLVKDRRDAPGPHALL